MSELIKKSKKLSFYLRHNPDSTLLSLDDKGWAKVSSVKKLLGVNQVELEEIVEKNDKKRFELSEDKLKIRARQGHSIEVDLQLEEVTDEIKGTKLYHGTKMCNIGHIMKEGLKKMNRHHVHLTKDLELAKKRAGKNNPVLVIIPNGEKVWKSANDVYLMDSVPTSIINFFETYLYK